jgi:deoxyribodipyrimidine photolyase-related protein
MPNTILILGDQLSREHSALAKGKRKIDRVLMIEFRNGPRAHKIKRVFQFAAMRHFAEELVQEGWQVDYHSFEHTPDFEAALSSHLEAHRPDEIHVMQPNNWCQEESIRRVASSNGAHISISPTCQFVTTREEFFSFAKGKQRLLMEAHYRRARQKLSILIDNDGNPEGGAWNFDTANRKTLTDWKKEGAPKPPTPLTRNRSRDKITTEVITSVEKYFPDDIGRAEDCWLPVTRRGALEMLANFIRARLPRFGDFQDLMLQDSPTMFHSLVAAPINLGLLSPMECVEAALEAYRQGQAPLAAVEGFVRQIIGWREFVNGIYWLKMPDYLSGNSLQATIPLPKFFYSGETEMNCMKCAINEVRDTAYNHHIQRLMILGNFCLIAGINPQEAHNWFLEMYIDAHEWVMAANVLGMALHADGGFMSTKPYAASAAYISKMSNYCSSCQFDPKKKNGPGACPFNLLYWDFYDRHADRFASNPRTSMMVNTWKKRPEREKQVIRQEAELFLASIKHH